MGEVLRRLLRNTKNKKPPHGMRTSKANLRDNGQVVLRINAILGAVAELAIQLAWLHTRLATI